MDCFLCGEKEETPFHLYKDCYISFVVVFSWEMGCEVGWYCLQFYGKSLPLVYESHSDGWVNKSWERFGSPSLHFFLLYPMDFKKL